LVKKHILDDFDIPYVVNRLVQVVEEQNRSGKKAAKNLGKPTCPEVEAP
jgi:hypothetical protein